MMLKNPSSGWLRLSWLAVLPFLAGTMFLCNPVRAKVVSVQPEITALSDTTEVVPFSEVDIKPTFQGGDALEFSKWVNENLKYPENAKNSGAQGRITLRFTIGTDGKVGDVKVLRGIDPELDAEVLRVVSASPDWTPGYVKGEPVKVTYVFPVIFKLRDTKQDAVQVVEGNANISVRGTATDSVLVVIDGKPGYTLKEMQELDVTTVESIQVLKDEAAVAKYGEKGRKGVIVVTTKKQ